MSLSTHPGASPTILVHRPRCPVSEQIPVAGMQLTGPPSYNNIPQYNMQQVPAQTAQQIHLAAPVGYGSPNNNMPLVIPQNYSSPAPTIMISASGGSPGLSHHQSPTGVIVTASASSSQPSGHHTEHPIYAVLPAAAPVSNSNCCNSNKSCCCSHNNSSGCRCSHNECKNKKDSVVHHVVHNCSGRSTRRHSRHHCHRRHY